MMLPIVTPDFLGFEVKGFFYLHSKIIFILNNSLFINFFTGWVIFTINKFPIMVLNSVGEPVPFFNSSRLRILA